MITSTATPLVLDTGPLGMIAHPRRRLDIGTWFDAVANSSRLIYLPEIADYEVRRNFLLEDLSRALERLDGLKNQIIYLPLSTTVIKDAAGLWAEARKRGRPTGDPRELDGDVILAAQTLSVGGIVVTDNIGHLAQFVESTTWQDLVV